MNKDTFPISKEGWNYIGFSIALFIFSVLFSLSFFILISLIFIAFFGFLYRNPEREIPSLAQDSVVSPVDGRVVYIENLVDSEYAYRVEIDSNCSNVGFCRTPMNSTVVDLKLVRGTKLSTSSNLFTKLNENVEIIFENGDLNRLKITHFSKVSFDDLKIDLVNNQMTNLSSRYGFMLNGLTSLYLPKNFQLDIRAGTHVIASQTLIGSFK